MQIPKLMSQAQTTLKTMSQRIREFSDEPLELAFLLLVVLMTLVVSILFAIEQPDLAILIGGFATLSAGIIGMNARRETWIREIAPELIGISIGVIAIDRLYQIRLEQQEKRATILQLGSLSNDFALEASRIARERGWLFDGTLEKAVFWGASLQNAMLAEANLRGTTLTEANLAGANLWQADLTNAILRYADLTGARLSHISGKGVDLNRAILTGADLSWSDFSGADLRGANLQNARLGVANLERATLENANLHGAYVESAVLVGANLNGANLTGANLTDAIMFDAQGVHASLENAAYDATTLWPDGFSPQEFGALKKD